MEEQISGGAEGLRGREHCTQTLSGADMGRMSGGKKNNKRPVRNNNPFHGASLSCDIWKGQSVLLLPDLWECWCELSGGLQEHERVLVLINV